MAVRKLLIVDDESSNLELFSEVFEDDEDLEVICSESGDDALAQFQHHQPEVIILDIMMPGTNGFLVCEKIKQMSQGKTKVIMITGMAGREVEQKATSCGCDRFYLKPVSIATLRNEVLQVSDAS